MIFPQLQKATIDTSESRPNMEYIVIDKKGVVRCTNAHVAFVSNIRNWVSEDIAENFLNKAIHKYIWARMSLKKWVDLEIDGDYIHLIDSKGKKEIQQINVDIEDVDGRLNIKGVGTYPNLDAVIPDNKVAVEAPYVAVNAKLLSDLQDCFNGGEAVGLKLISTGLTKAIKVESTSESKHPEYGVIMPVLPEQ